MQKKLLKNFLYQASYQVLLIILPIITIPIVSSALGPEGIGTFNFINSIVAYFVLVAGLGMANYGVREIAIVRDDKIKLSKKFWELEIFNSFFSMGTMILFILFSFFSDNKIYFLVSGITIFSSLFEITWFFSGVEDFKKITIINFFVKIMSFIFIVLFINGPEDLLLYIFITSFSTLVSQLSLWIPLRKYIIWVPVSLKGCMTHFRPSMDFFVAKIAMTIYQNVTKTVLGLMTTMTIVGYYSNSLTIITMAGSIIHSMNTIMIPQMSSMFGNNNEKGMIKLLQKSIHLQIFFTIAIMFGIIAISNNLVGWFFGEKFLAIKYVLPWLAPVVVSQSLQQAVATQYLIPKNNMKEYNRSILMGALMTVIITVTLVPIFKIYGAVLGINIGYMVISFSRMRVLIKETSFIFEYKKILRFIISGFIMWIAIYFGTNSLDSSIWVTFLQIIIGVMVYFGSTTLLRVNPIYDFIKERQSK